MRTSGAEITIGDNMINMLDRFYEWVVSDTSISWVIVKNICLKNNLRCVFNDRDVVNILLSHGVVSREHGDILVNPLFYDRHSYEILDSFRLIDLDLRNLRKYAVLVTDRKWRFFVVVLPSSLEYRILVSRITGISVCK